MFGIFKNNIKRLSAAAVIFIFSAILLSAEKREILLGGRKGWADLKYQDSVTIGKGRYGYDCIELATNSFVFDETTDLLIDFEDPQNPISAGNYEIVSNHLKTSTQAIMEKNAGLSRNLGGVKGDKQIVEKAADDAAEPVDGRVLSEGFQICHGFWGNV